MKIEMKSYFVTITLNKIDVLLQDRIFKNIVVRSETSEMFEANNFLYN